MADVGVLIADLIKAGLDGELVGRVAAALAEREAVLVPDEAAERRRAADRERKREERLRMSADVGRVRGQSPSPKEAPHTPEEKTPTEPSTHKENPLRGQKKGSRLPDDFAPDFEFAVREGLSRSQAEAEFAKFRDFWTAKPGAGGVKLDWQATWRNWVRTSLERSPNARAGPRPGKVTAMDHFRNFASEINGQAGNDRGDSGNRDDAPGVPFRAIEHHG